MAGLGALEAVAAATCSRSLVDQAGRLVVDTAPLPVVEHTVQILKTADKPVIRAVVVATAVGASAAIGRLPPHAARYVVTAAALAVRPPLVDVNRWRLRVTGSVAEPRS